MMNVVLAIKQGLQQGTGYFRLAFIIYGMQLLLTMMIGLQVYEVIEASIGHTAAVEEIIQGYNHTVLSDLINVHGASLSPLLGLVRWIALIYLIFSVFVHAGLLIVLYRNGDNWHDFWIGGARYFGPFLVMGFIFLGAILVWTSIIWIPFLSQLFALMEGMDRERPIFWVLFALLVIWLFGLSFFFSWSVTARLNYFELNSIRKSLAKAYKTAVHRFHYHLMVVGFYFALLLGLYGANFFLENSIGISSEILILVFLLIHQVIVYLKIWIRVVLYASMIRIQHTNL